MSAPPSSDTSKSQTQLLAEILKWVRFQGIQSAYQAVTRTITKDTDKLVYHYSDGRPSGEIAKLSGVSDFTVRSYWKSWAAMGLVAPSPNYKGRYERIFSLDQFGIDIPPSKVQPSSTQPSQPAETSQAPTPENQDQAKL